jgi:hypothetical protein
MLRPAPPHMNTRPTMAAMEIPAEHREFASAVAASQMQDPMPTFEALAAATRIPVPKLVHHALVRWTREGSEALLSVEPHKLRELIAAREREDWTKVGELIDWLAAGS